jgi:TM2 domain-containing membrane protein YozV
MSGFGRKGAMPTASVAPNQLSAQAQAFLASERARTQAERPAPANQSNVGRSSFGQDRADSSVPSYSFGVAPAKKSMVLAYVFWWFCAPLGAHRFYLGAYQSGAAMAGLFFGGLLLMFATGSGVPVILLVLWAGWTFADVCLIPGLTRRANGTGPEFAFQ